MIRSPLRRLALVAILSTLALHSSCLYAQDAGKAADLPAGALFRLGSSKFLHPGNIGLVVYSPDGKWLATAADDLENPLAYVWDAESGKEAAVLKGHSKKSRRSPFFPAAMPRPIRRW